MDSIDNANAIYDIWLSQRGNIGTIRAKLLAGYFGSAKAIYSSGYENFTSIEGLTKKMISELMDKDLSAAENVLAACSRAGCSVLGISDSDYPGRLRNIYDPPAVLYIKGKMPSVDELPVIGIVGTRRCTPYGYKHAQKTGRELSVQGAVVATGLASGIDTAAAYGALDGKMPVIGVIGCGIDVVYPVQNRKLFEKVTENGVIISEHMPGIEATPGCFPQRNRIISGLSIGVVVIEAPQNSGALITACRAIEQNRDVFVLPGSVDSKVCEGSNKLLREGAIPYLSAADIIEEYTGTYPQLKKPIDNIALLDYIDVDKIDGRFDIPQKTILKAISRKAMYIDEIIANTSLGAQSALATITALELDGLIGRDNTGKWEIK